MVHAPSLEPAALILAMREGAFYASTGVSLSKLDYGPSSQAIQFEITPEPGVTYKTEIYGTKRKSPNLPGELLGTIEGLKVHFPITDQELYIRATVTASKSHPNPSFKGQMIQAWTQPVGWKASR